MKHSNEKLRVGVLVERQRAYGRRLCEGIADYALAHPDISLGMLEWNDLSNAKKIADFDAFIVRVLDDQMEVALRRTGKPVVDVFYNRRRTGFAVVDLDNVAIARLPCGPLPALASGDGGAEVMRHEVRRKILRGVRSIRELLGRRDLP